MFNMRNLSKLLMIVTVTILLTVAFIPIFSYAAGVTPLAFSGGTCISGNCQSVANAYGYQISLIKYSGPKSNGNPVLVGKPILIYHPNLMKEITVHYKTSLPTSYDALASSNWGLTQMITKESDEDNLQWHGWANQSSNLFEGLGDNANTFPSDVAEKYEDQYGREYEYTSKDQIWYTYERGNTTCKLVDPYNEWISRSSYASLNDYKYGYIIYSQKFMTKEKKVTYKGGNYIDLSAFYKSYSESSLTSINALENLLSTKYLKNIASINTYFGVSIDYSEIDKYYIQVEPVQRIALNKEERTGSYHLSTLEKKIKESGTYSKVSIPRYDSYEATEDSLPEGNDNWRVWYDKSSPYDCKCKTGYKCPSGSTKNDDGDCISNETGEKVKKVSYKYNCQTCYQVSNIRYKLVLFHPNGYCGKIQKFYLYGALANGYSTVVTSRSLIGTGKTSEYYLNRAINYMNSNKHCVLDGNNNCTGVYQYYIGPSLEKGLVGGSSTNYYKFGDEGGPTGIKHYYLMEFSITCKDTCKSISDKTSDEYLKCAENYCDAQIDFDLKGNARIRKKACILACDYSYGKDPTSGSKDSPNRESVNSCSNSNPFKDKAQNANLSSTCSINNATGDDLENSKGAIVSCKGDNVTDFDNDDSNDTIFDQRTYINVACLETSGAGYTSFKDKKIFAGEGLNYRAKVDGKKECEAYFNLEQWKFDYATISSKDPDRRRRLLYIYDRFNHALEDDYKVTGKNYDPDFEAEKYGEVTWSDYEYDENKIKVETKVTEKVLGKFVENSTLKVSGYIELKLQSSKKHASATKIKEETVKEIYNMHLNNKLVNRYQQTSKVIQEYGYDKYCVTNDGKATVYKPGNARGVCYTTKSGREEVLGKNVYYTNLEADEGEGHKIDSNISVGTHAKNDTSYYSNQESCPYEIGSTDKFCVIDINPSSGTEMHGDGIYANGSIEVDLLLGGSLEKGETITSQTIEAKEKNGARTLNITGTNMTLGISVANKGDETYRITGVITTNKRTIRCSNEVMLVAQTGCTVNCSIEKEGADNTLYSIKSTNEGATRNYYTALSTDRTWKKVGAIKKNGINKYYVRLNRDLESVSDENPIIYGKVEGNGCSNVCWKKTKASPENTYDCKALYKAGEIGKINEYCDKNWQKDIRNYKSKDDCIVSCQNRKDEPNACPNNRKNLSEVKEHCRLNYAKLNYYSESDCVNHCYVCEDCVESEYIYRPIDINDPFPNSPISVIPGNRIIGSNWVGKEEYAKEKINGKVEYVIDLTPNDIRNIRNSTKSYNNSGETKDAYIDYVYMEGVDQNQRYYSKFINEDFRSSFSVIKGVNS